MESFVNWYDSWKPGKKPALLAGNPGVGKSSLVKAFAKERGIDFIEVNASDKRNSSSLQEIVGQSSKQMSLFMRGKIILLDEVDGLSGSQDRGAASELMGIAKESKFPIAMTANDAYSLKLKNVRMGSELIKFSKINSLTLAAQLRKVAELEGAELDKESSRHLAMISGGDMRSALNDLHTLISSNKIVRKEDIDSLGYREKNGDIFELMKIIFKTSTVKTSLEKAYSTDKDPDEIFWWIEQNIPLEYERPDEIAKAYDWLSRADVMKSRIRKNQNWRFQKYMVDLMCGGVSISKNEMYRKFSRFMPPNRLIKMGSSKVMRARRKEVCSMLTKEVHTSSSKIISDYFPLFKIMAKSNPDEVVNFLGIEREDLKMF